MNHFRTFICAGALVALNLNAWADTIYDSTGSYNGNSFSMGNGQEVGNEISLTAGVWSLTNFSIEYYSPNFALAPNVGIDVRFYEDNGTPSNGFNTPGTIFYDSGWFFNPPSGLPGNGYQVVTYTSSDFTTGATPLTMALPGDFTFTITFTNLNVGNLVDLPLANNQSPISYGDYWLNNGGSWTLMTNAHSAANFVVDFAGTVPEPSSFGLAAIGGVLLLGINKLRRKL